MKKKMLLISLALLLAMSLVAIGCPPVDEPIVIEPPVVELIDGHLDVVAEYGMVATAHPLATQAGVEILRAGGNAIDAAVAAAFTLGVVEPHASGLGGGGFMLFYSADTGEVTVIDYADVAPGLATDDMFLDPAGEAICWLVRSISYPASAVPGQVAGLTLALERYGTFSLADTLCRAIQHAEEGIIVEGTLHGLLRTPHWLAWLNQHPAAAAIFTVDGQPFEYGSILVQEDLAQTLRLIAEYGPDAFYRGPIAEAIAAHHAAVGGLITMEDLANFQPVIREPLRTTYRGFEIFTMPPPSAGGMQIIQMLNMLEVFDLAAIGHNSALHIHLLAETMKRSFADRLQFIADPAFVEVPIAGLISKEYAAERRRDIRLGWASEQDEVVFGDPTPFGPSTTHLVVVDGEGNVVSMTNTINWWFGSSTVIPGTGILLNNEMADFNPLPGYPNSIEPGKRPKGSMSPTIVLRDGQPFLTIGSPGGMRILTAVLQIVSNVIDFGMGMQAAIDAPRMHCEGDAIRMEDRIPEEVRAELEAMGHEIEVRGAFDRHFGGAQGILLIGDMMRGGADPRLDGVAIGIDVPVAP